MAGRQSHKFRRWGFQTEGGFPTRTRPCNGRGRSRGQTASAQAASLCSAGIERARKRLRGEHFVRCCRTTHCLLLRGFPGVARGGQQQFATQTLRVHLLGLQDSFGNGPKFNTVSESTVSDTELTPHSLSFLVLTEFRRENSVSSSRPTICVPKRTHRVFRRTHRVCPKTQ